MMRLRANAVDVVQILVIDDNEDDYRRVRKALSQIASIASDVHWEKSYEAGLAALLKHSADVCLLGRPSGARSGLELLTTVRDRKCVTGVIVLTDGIEPRLAERSLECGADDYVDRAELCARILERRLHNCLQRTHRAALSIHERIVQAMPDGVWTCDENSKTTFVNGQLATMLGYAPDEMLGMSAADLLAEPQRTPALIERRHHGMSERIELLLRRTDGSILPASVHVTPLHGTDGRCTGALAVVTDATEQRRTQEAMRSLEAQLRQAQKLEAIGTLAGGIAHDFNNILSVVLSYCSLLDQELDPVDHRREDVQQIQGAAQRAAELTQQLLAFSRKQVLQPQLIDLNQRLADSHKILRRLVKENIDFAVVPRAAGRVFADPIQVEQILLNLTVNAADAMPNGGSLTIETDNVDLTEAEAMQYEGAAAGPYVRLTVTDTGVGIPREIQLRIFEPFFTTKEWGKGTGLGLSTVFGIVRQSGGFIALESEPGKGSSFKILLPRVASGELPIERADSATIAVRGAGRVLVVEDDDLVRNTVGDVLSRAGYTTLLARNANEALVVSEQSPAKIDLLLTDVVMPHMSGRELAERLVRIRPHLKVLYMSGYTDNAIVHHGVLDPGLSLLRKPFTSDTLTARVREALDSSGEYDCRTGTSG